jgi:hypothetical protein
MTHKTATLSHQELHAEIDQAFDLGEDGPRFCDKPYVGLAVCARIGGHEGEHVTVGLTGRIIGF